MLVLALATAFSASFGLVMRYALARNRNLWAVGALNYGTAALFHLLRHALGGGHAPSQSTWVVGLLGGMAYVTAYLLYFPLMAMRGVSVSTAIVRLSALIPVVVSVVVWGEQPSTQQVLGALLALASLPLLSFSPGIRGKRLPGRATALLMALFLANGLCLLAVRGYSQTGVAGEESWFLAILFGMAAVIATGAYALHGERASWGDLLPGMGLGVCNALGNLLLVMALGQLPGFLVFPFQAAVGLALSAVVARLVWGERISRLETAGMAVAVVAVVFMNVR